MVLETWVPGTHTTAEKKIEIEAKSKKLSTFLSFHNTSDLAEYFGGKLQERFSRRSLPSATHNPKSKHTTHTQGHPPVERRTQRTSTVCSSIMKTFGTVKYLERKYCKIYAKSLKKAKKGLQ